MAALREPQGAVRGFVKISAMKPHARKVKTPREAKRAASPPIE